VSLAGFRVFDFVGASGDTSLINEHISQTTCPSRTTALAPASHVQQNGLLSHLQDLDAPLRLAAQRKINGYRQQYADNQNISFLLAIMSTYNRTHGEFLRRRTSLPLECHRNATNLTCSV
jgi:hypothetical protein